MCLCIILTKMSKISALHSFFSTLLLLLGSTKGNIDDILKDYRTLTKGDIHQVVTRRNADGQIDKVISFNTLGRNFLLHLSPNSGLFSENFKAYGIDGTRQDDIQIDKLNFYKGYVEGEDHSHVSLHLKDGMMTASIATSNETYVIEVSYAFSYQPEWKKYCLAHLFTYQDFDDGVIGLAYVGNPRRSAVGGICTEDYRTGGRTLYLNTGLSSSVNWGRRVLTEEADIVTAHEFGHNFGSEHDPEDNECAPSERSGGKFIMYPASVSGQRSNNKLFSPCSKRQINAVLQSKAQYCFIEPRSEICGNYKKEPGEECDPGSLGTIDTPCCTKDCKLKKDAQCSDGYDNPCCKNCKYAAGKVCRRRDPNFCQDETICRPNDAKCPPAPPLPDNTVCVERGKCRSGKCVEFCVSEGMEPCLCQESDNACKVCCKKINSTQCLPWKNATSGEMFTMVDGRPCASGSCRKGKCEQITQDAVEKFWTFLTNLDANAFVEFMRANIVGTIMFFSLCIWIPVSCIIHRIDKRNEKAEVQEQEWRDPKNTQLLRNVEPTSKGVYIYRQDSFTRPMKPMKPLKLKPVYIRTRQRPGVMDVATVNESQI
ncbi:disintegrin and metalloproteinase domain-containing protein 17 [Exaiptasia diaphana]|uniref:ADAM 17-like protease n=1 Tax=Exaiptasia diaphana TaxID=2652724 RepID=A0A913YTN9_EXADI|nr:disintegrin and metalloproteinase domain-containing protein 17 [Exaiptasia diaphana]